MQAEIKTVVPGPCPCCNTEIQYLYKTENIPYFSDILIISAICPACGYKFVDTQLLKQADPARYTFAVDTVDDLSIRVVRSMSAAIEIPELGVRIDPGPLVPGIRVQCGGCARPDRTGRERVPAMGERTWRRRMQRHSLQISCG